MSVLQLQEAASSASPSLPLDAFRVLTGQVHYGGRVTDHADQGVVDALLDLCLNAALSPDPRGDPRLAPLAPFLLPSDYSYADIKQFVRCLPLDAPPELLGLDESAQDT